jgi:hypothetical protein
MARGELSAGDGRHFSYSRHPGVPGAVGQRSGAALLPYGRWIAEEAAKEAGLVRASPGRPAQTYYCFRLDAVVSANAFKAPAADEKQESPVMPPSLLQFAQSGTQQRGAVGSRPRRALGVGQRSRPLLIQQ